MPIEKLSNKSKIHTDLRSSTMVRLSNKICCYICKETVFTLIRVRNASGSKVKPSLYICSPCSKK